MSTRIDPRSMSVLEHQMRERFGDPHAFGVPFPPPPGVFVKAGTLIGAIVGADGNISPREREALASVSRFFGASEAEASLIANVDPKGVDLVALARELPPTLAGTLLYDAIRVASVDGFHEKETQVAIKAAKALGFDPSFVPMAAALIAMEDVVADNRRKLLSSPSDLTRHGKGPMIAAGEETRNRDYGNSGPMPRDFAANIGKAILVVAAADGDLNDRELAWFIGQARSVGTPEDVVEELLKFDAVGKSMETYVTNELRPFARGIVWDAIRTASADGYHDKERALATKAAAKLGLDPTFVVALENQLRVEESLRSARLALARRR